jgi:hypothetical protein
MAEGEGALNAEQLERLARYFDEEVISTRNHKPQWVKVPRPATG